MRIWWQSFVDGAQNRPYIERLGGHLAEIADDGTTVDVSGITPPDRHFGRLTEFRCAAIAIDNAIEAQAQGFDAFVMGHFQDPGLYEARSAVDIPVIGLGEVTMHWAAQLGRNLALISIDPVFERWHLEQGDLYGLAGRVSHVRGLGVVVEDFAPAFAGDHDAYARLVSSFRAIAQPLVDDGADVIIPAGALPGLLLAREHGMTVGHAPVVNCVVVALKLAEAATRIARLTGLGPSRGPSFARAPQGAIDDFRAFVAGGRGAVT
ncbi:MAG: aspartate/glutamate racemase family protein [Gaiellales bacterium]